MSEKLEILDASQVSDNGPQLENYRALVKLSYGGKQALVGDIINDIPSQSLGWLLEGNYIEKVN